MKNTRICYLGFAMMVSFSATIEVAYAQNPTNPLPPWVERVQERRREQDDLAGKDSRGMIDRSDPTRVEPPVYRYPTGKPYSREDLALIEERKKPDPAVVKQHESFLDGKKTGIFRLFSFLPCVERFIIRADGECADYIPDSWAFSFRSKRYSPSDFFDLKLKEGVFSTGGALTFSVLTNLGDVPIESVGLDSQGVRFLADLKPETEQTAAEAQIRRFIKGFESEGYRYSLNAKAAEKRTFALRVVAYQAPGNVRIYSKSFPGYPLDLNRMDDREDVIVVFRVVRTDPSDLTIIWKELRRSGSPKLGFPKGTKSVQIAPVD